MLTADFVSARRQGDELKLVKLGARQEAAQALAEELIGIAESSVGTTRAELESAWGRGRSRAARPQAALRAAKADRRHARVRGRARGRPDRAARGGLQPRRDPASRRRALRPRGLARCGGEREADGPRLGGALALRGPARRAGAHERARADAGRARPGVRERAGAGGVASRHRPERAHRGGPTRSRCEPSFES